MEFPVQKQEPKKAPEPPAPIHLDAAPKPEEHDHFDELEQMVNHKNRHPGLLLCQSRQNRPSLKRLHRRAA